MKFSHGAWQWANGVEPVAVRRVYDHRTDGDALLITALDRHGDKGSQRFDGVVLDLRITSPMPDVIRVQASHHRPAETGVTKFDLDYDLRADGVRIEDHADHLLFTSGRLSVRFNKNSWEMTFLDGTSVVTRAGHEGLALMRVAGQGNYLSQRLSMAVGECLYGMGERFGPLVKNGQSVRIWNEDGGTASDLAYKNVPFYLSSRGYGLLVNSPGDVQFEVGTERVSQVQFSVPGESFDYYVFLGPDPKDVLDKYTRLAGRPALPPAWSFGLWLSTSFTTHYDEQTVNAFIDGMAERGIPLSVFHFDCFWMKERRWCDFKWDTDAFPDPEGMLRRLKAKGLKICVWINPYISQLSEMFDEGRANGYLLKRRDGSVYQIDQWQPGMAIVDFTNPWAVEWYCGKLAALLDMGVDCFKTDFAERIPLDVVYHDGSDPSLMHNYYAYLYNKCVFDLVEGHHGKNEAMVFARSGTAGCQKFPVHWGGDCEATFESMAEDLRGGLSFCLSGNAFWSHDIGGFSGKANASLYKRWVAFGLLSTHSRLHGSESYRVPWLFDEESVDVMRHFVHLKNSLFPYLFAASHDAAMHGWPVMRAMMLEFPNDPNCLHLDRQYLLGSSLLVAPVFRQDDVAEYYLPEGRWTHWQSGLVIDGGQWHREKLGFMDVPLFARENSVIPTSANHDAPLWHAKDELLLQLFQIADASDQLVAAAASNGDGVSTFRCARDGRRITVRRESGSANQVSTLLRSVHVRPERVQGGQAMDHDRRGLFVRWTDVAVPLVIHLPSEEDVAPTRSTAVKRHDAVLSAT